jgi:cold-inducible RNA-binding protein
VGTKLYVGNLSYGIGKAELEQLFTPYGGVVSAQVIVDRETQRSKGFGFVEMASDPQAQAAISALNGKSVEGRALTVNEARPQEQRNGGGAYAGARRPGGTRGPYGTGRGGSGGTGRY